MHELLAGLIMASAADEPVALATVRAGQRRAFVAAAGAVVDAPADRAAATRLRSYRVEIGWWTRGHGFADLDALAPADLDRIGRAFIETNRHDEARPWYEEAVAETRQGDIHGRVDHASLGRSLQALDRLGR
jgi:hypothetical protein